MPKMLCTCEASVKNAATEVTGVMALKSSSETGFCTSSKLSKGFWVSKSLPPTETKLPAVRFKVKLPASSDEPVDSPSSAVKLSF